MTTLTYRTLLAVVGVTTFWLCFSCLWHERAAQDLGLPLDPFKSWAKTGERAGSALTMIGIFACWPFAITSVYFLWRNASKAASSGASRWKRLPHPFPKTTGVTSLDQKLIGGFYLILFWAIPAIHVIRFTDLFFHGAPPRPMFFWNWRAWVFGEDKTATDILYKEITYFGWTPFAVMLGVTAFVILSIKMWRAILRTAV